LKNKEDGIFSGFLNEKVPEYDNNVLKNSLENELSKQRNKFFLYLIPNCFIDIFSFLSQSL
jgi:hypothetical protein